jgi:hypothetical protein
MRGFHNNAIIGQQECPPDSKRPFPNDPLLSDNPLMKLLGLAEREVGR